MPDIVGPVAVGSTVTASVDFGAELTGDNEGHNFVFTSLQGHLSCDIAGQWPCASSDGNVFNASATGTGSGACAGVTFTISEAADETITFTPSSPLVIADGTTCTVTFSVTAVAVPADGETFFLSHMDTLTATGTGSYNGEDGATITFTFTDAGEPGSRDRATIIIKDPSGATVLNVSANLDMGNHQAHKK